MNVFESHLDEFRSIVESPDLKARSGISFFDPKLTWPEGKSGDIILSNETAIELGHPNTESLALLMWTDAAEKVQDGQITIIGPELNEYKTDRIPYGKFTLIRGTGFTKENAFDRFQEMNFLRFRTHLQGYMIRAVPRQNREWSRISRKSLQSGFSLRHLGNELIREYKKLPYIESVEMVFVTSSAADIRKFATMGESVSRITQAMNRMFDDLEMDCHACDFSDVCDEIEGLRDMHQQALGN